MNEKRQLSNGIYLLVIPRRSRPKASFNPLQRKRKMPAIPKGILLKGAPTDPRGRSIVAARAFRPGEVIATFGSPSVAIPDSPHLTTTCSGCLTPANSADPPLPLMQIDVRACSGCRAVAYCSVRCQRLDWTTGGHKAECKIFKKVRSEGHDALPTPVRALVHILLRPEMRAALEELEGHVDRFERDGGKLWTNMELQSMGALHYLGREPSVENLTEAIEIFCKVCSILLLFFFPFPPFFIYFYIFFKAKLSKLGPMAILLKCEKIMGKLVCFLDACVMLMMLGY